MIVTWNVELSPEGGINDKREMKEVRTVSIEQIVKSVIAEWRSACAAYLMQYCNPDCIGNVHCPFICPYQTPMIIIVSSQWTIQGVVTWLSYPKRSLPSRCIRRFALSWLAIFDVVSHERLRNLGWRIVDRFAINQPSWYAVNSVNGGSVTLLWGNQAHFIELVDHLGHSFAVAFP